MAEGERRRGGRYSVDMNECVPDVNSCTVPRAVVEDQTPTLTPPAFVSVYVTRGGSRAPQVSVHVTVLAAAV